ncbi:hypothetical protein Msi02_01500 [Microbispora siamensis]|uniref:Uncharacterized protein n=1 Tax=Microbispora siamensis TaxID=564413 RepID=A0ABQ4GD32_9ACTN|nr:hypothetical protein Msi02_01500 [Microbispora siamensis]
MRILLGEPVVCLAVQVGEQCLEQRLREIMMPFFFNRFYEKATGWLYDHDPGQLPMSRTS